MVAYRTAWGDAPVGWDGSDISYLITDYTEDTQILLEGSPDAYHYEFVDVTDTLKQIFELTRKLPFTAEIEK